jgi:hypothetical protein
MCMRTSVHGGRSFRWRCKRCVGEAVTRRHQKVKRILVEEAGGCCAVCGYDRCIVNLQFHHVNPQAKSFAVTVASGKSLDAYRSEAAKCVLGVRELPRRDRGWPDSLSAGTGPLLGAIRGRLVME